MPGRQGILVTSSIGRQNSILFRSVGEPREKSPRETARAKVNYDSLGELVSGLNQMLDFRILGDQGRICGLPVQKTDQLSDSYRFFGIAAVN
jgi:hypothetical protein